MMDPRALADRLRDRFPDVVVARDEATVVVDAGDLHRGLRYLGEEPDLDFGFLSDLSATDWPDREPRFWVAYQLLSMRYGHRLRVKVGLPSDRPVMPSVVSLLPTANWFERELYDFFGIEFDGHPDLSRIIMPDDWEGFPLRKDYS